MSYFQLSPFPDTKPIEVGPFRTSFVVKKLEAYVIYKFVISAKNQQGSSVKSSPASARTYEKSKIPFVLQKMREFC